MTAERKPDGDDIRRRAVAPETNSLEMPPHHYEDGFVVVEAVISGDTGAQLNALRDAAIRVLGEAGFLGDFRVTIVAKGQVRRNG